MYITLSKPSNAYKIDNWYKWLEHVEQMASAMKMGRKVLNIQPEHAREKDTAYETYSFGTRNKRLENVE
jgi:hypothetical protein